MLILIYPIEIFQDLNIHQFCMPYCIHNHTYWDSTYHLYKNSNHLILCTHTEIHHYSIFALNYIHFHSIYIYTHAVHAESCFIFTCDIKLNTFTLIFFTLSEKHIQAYGLSIVLQIPPHLLTLTVEG